MNMMDMLRAAQGGKGIENLARQHGLTTDQAEQVLAKVLPAMSAGFKARAQSGDGFEEMIQKIHGTDYEDVYEDPSALQRDDIRDRGNALLGEIFGSKEVSREVAQRTEFASGIGSSIVKAMLPMIVSMVFGGMQRKTSTNSGMGGIVDMLLRGGQTSRQQGGGGLGDILGAVLGGGGAARQPQGGGGLADILGAVLGGGGAKPQAGGGGLSDILGGMLGGGQQAPQQRGGGGGLSDIFGGGAQQASAPSRGGLDELLGGLLGANPRQRQSTGDPNLDGVIGMFDANGDGEVDADVLRQLARRR